MRSLIAFGRPTAPSWRVTLQPESEIRPLLVEASGTAVKLPAPRDTCNEAPSVESHREDPGDIHPTPRGVPNSDLLRMAILIYGAMLAAAILWSLLSSASIFYPFPDAQRGVAALLLDVLAGAAVAAVVIGLSDAITRRTRWGERMARELIALIGKRSVRDCIVLGMASGVAEEVFFRGAMQPHLGLVATSLIFGMVHLTPKRDLLPWAGFALCAGFLLGELYVVTESLVAPITAHVGINVVNLRRLGTRYG